MNNNKITLHYNNYEQGKGLVPCVDTFKDMAELQEFFDISLERMETMLYGSWVDLGDEVPHKLMVDLEQSDDEFMALSLNGVPIILSILTTDLEYNRNNRGLCNYSVAFTSLEQLYSFLGNHLPHIPMIPSGSWVDLGNGLEHTLKIVIM